MRQIPFYFFINLNPNEIKQSDIKEKNFMMKHNLLDFHFFSNFVDFIKRNIEYKFAVGCSCIQAEAIEPMLAFQSLVATGEHRKACLSHWEGKTHIRWHALHLVIGGSKRMVWFTYLENNCPSSNGISLFLGRSKGLKMVNMISFGQFVLS